MSASTGDVDFEIAGVATGFCCAKSDAQKKAGKRNVSLTTNEG